MNARGQANLMVPIIGFVLGMALAIFPYAIFAYALDVNFAQLNQSHDYYESGRMAYRFHAHEENGVFSSQELENLKTSECSYQNMPEGWNIRHPGWENQYNTCESYFNLPVYTFLENDKIVKYMAVKN